MSNELATLKMDPKEKVLLKRNLGKNGTAHLYFANMVMRMSDPYVPMDTGTMKNLVHVVPNTEGAYIIYPAIYSRYHWHGKVMVGRAPKKVTNRNMNYRSRRRGPYWTQRMWADRGKEIVAQTARYTGGHL